MIQKLWHNISNLGTEDTPEEDRSLTRSYNRMALFSAGFAITMTLMGLIFQAETTYLYITFSIFITYFLILLLNSMGKIIESRILVSILSPIWICGAYMLIGGYFSQSLAICATCAITYVAFQRKPRIAFIIIAFSILLYTFSVFFVNTYGPVFGVIDFAFDEYLVFLSSMGWVIIVLLRFNREREDLIDDLKRKNKDLERTTEELERFTYIASHDLKSPLRTIISFIGLIERDLQQNKYEGLEDKLQFVKSGAEQMNFLIEDILEISRLNSPKNSVKEPVNLNTVLNQALAGINNEIKQSDAEINSSPLPLIYGDIIELNLLFQNIIQNGIKYNQSIKPKVHINAECRDDKLHITFEDNGIGIPVEYHDQIFSFFKRLHTNVEYTGTGLGLGLCRKIMNKYQGEILLESELNQGSKFTLVFPNEALVQKDVCMDRKSNISQVYTADVF